MDTEALIYSGEGGLQPPGECSQYYTVHPMSAVKLMYRDCLNDDDKALVSNVWFFIEYISYRNMVALAMVDV